MHKVQSEPKKNVLALCYESGHYLKHVFFLGTQIFLENMKKISSQIIHTYDFTSILQPKED